MKHLTKLFRATIAIVIMLCVALPTYANDFVVDGIYYNITSEADKTVAVTFPPNSSSGDLLLDFIVDAYQEYYGEIIIPTSVTYNGIEYSVSSIGFNAFSECTGLTSVTIPNSVTSIGSYAFNNCIGLTEVNITDLSAWCKIDFGSYDSNPLYYAKKLKLNGTEIKDLIIPNDITEIKGYAFRGCDGLTSVTIPNSVTTIGSSAFDGCTGLTSVSIPNSVTSIGYLAFYNCTGLTSLSIPNSVTSISNGAFSQTGWYNNQQDGIINLDNCCLGYKGTAPIGVLSLKEGTRLIGDFAFNNCTGLTLISIPNSVTSIGAHAFLNTEWYNNQTDGVLYLDNYCLGYKGNAPTGVLSLKEGTRFISNAAFEDCVDLDSITIPNSVTSIGERAFYNCGNLLSITIPNSVVYIGKGAFEGCNNLNSLNLNSEFRGDVYMFRNCPNLKQLYIGGDINSISSEMFSHCSGLTSVTISNSVTTIGNSAFSGCTGLTSITIPNSVTTIGNYAFDGCKGLTSITIPNSVTTIGNYAFYNTGWYNNQQDGILYLDNCCLNYKGDSPTETLLIKEGTRLIASGALHSYKTIKIPKSVEYITRCPICPLYRNSSLLRFDVDNKNKNYKSYKDVLFNKDKTVLICFPNGKTGKYSIPNSVTSIGEFAFFYCDGLTSVTIPNSVTEIGSYAFFGCDGLTSVTIPNSVTEIGTSVFFGCTNLETITIYNPNVKIGLASIPKGVKVIMDSK